MPTSGLDAALRERERVHLEATTGRIVARFARSARALGTAFVSPNLAPLISKRGGSRRVGAALGVHNAANSLGQASGPLLGGALFIWQLNAPYLLTGALLVTVASVIAWKAML